MIMRLFFGILIFTSLLSCVEEAIKKPENLIPREKMSLILYDLALVNSAKSTNPAILREHNIEIMPYIYEKYGIDSAQFVNSDIYYASRPAEYETIYRVVEQRLQKEKEEMEEERRRVSDSVRIEAEKRREAQQKKDSVK